MIVAIHQPNFMPFYGFFCKIIQADKFVLLDDVQFEKNSYINRVNIYNPNTKQQWLTCPLDGFKFGMKINEIKLNADKRWKIKQLKTLKQVYQKAKYFTEVYPIIEYQYTQKHDSLLDFNLDLLFAITKFLNIDKSKFQLASEFNIQETSNERLVEICNKLDAKTYIHGRGAKKYHNEEIFSYQNIKLELTKTDLSYSQFQESEFIPNLSIIDLLFHYGEKTMNILSNTN